MILAQQTNWGDLNLELLTPEILTLPTNLWRSVADIAEEHENTQLLPEHLQYYSRERGLRLIQESFQRKFTQAKIIHKKYWTNVIPEEEFKKLRNHFVQQWAKENLTTDPDTPFLLDQEQAETVAESGVHIKVTARAGSGKTRSLVTRVIFQIKHCQVPPKQILILAFNKKAVAEIANRLSEHLPEQQMPHVMTFHALAYRLVHPSEDLIYDPEGSDLSKKFSQKIQNIIHREINHGDLKTKILNLLENSWSKSLFQIMKEGLHLSGYELELFRERLEDETIDLRRVSCPRDRIIGNYLFRRDCRYFYKKNLNQTPHSNYAPEFTVYFKENKNVIIELSKGSSCPSNESRLGFQMSDFSNNFSSFSLLDYPENLLDPTDLIQNLDEVFSNLKIKLTPLSKEDLWEKLEKSRITSFTNSIKNFISRAQKELLWPSELEDLLEDKNNQNEDSELQKKFWNIALNIYKKYEKSLTDHHEIDFDRVMIKACDLIYKGSTELSSSYGKADLSTLSHILIDEFQDFSHLFNKMRSAITQKNANVTFFCVGDDWQAINKFMGSNLEYFSKFHENFTPCKNLSITTNYRSASSIVHAGNNVMQNSGIASTTREGAIAGSILLTSVNDSLDLSEPEKAMQEKLGPLAVNILRLAQQHLSKKPHNTKRLTLQSPKIAVLSRRIAPNRMTPEEGLERGC